MYELQKGDTVVLYPPLGKNPSLALYSGQEAVIAEEPVMESKWCLVQMNGDMEMKMPKHWFRKR